MHVKQLGKNVSKEINISLYKVSVSLECCILMIKKIKNIAVFNVFHTITSRLLDVICSDCHWLTAVVSTVNK